MSKRSRRPPKSPAVPGTPRAHSEAALHRLIAARWAFWVMAAAAGLAPRRLAAAYKVPAAVPLGADLALIPAGWRTGAYEPGPWAPAGVDPETWLRETPEGSAWLDARAAAVSANAGLLVEYVKTRIEPRSGTEDTATDDVWSAARAGLVHGCDLWDPAHRVAPSTYLRYWIRSGVGKELDAATRRSASTQRLADPDVAAYADDSPEEGWIEAIDAASVLSERRLAAVRPVEVVVGQARRRIVVGAR